MEVVKEGGKAVKDGGAKGKMRSKCCKARSESTTISSAIVLTKCKTKLSASVVC